MVAVKEVYFLEDVLIDVLIVAMLWLPRRVWQTQPIGLRDLRRTSTRVSNQATPSLNSKWHHFCITKLNHQKFWFKIKRKTLFACLDVWVSEVKVASIWESSFRLRGMAWHYGICHLKTFKLEELLADQTRVWLTVGLWRLFIM